VAAIPGMLHVYFIGGRILGLITAHDDGVGCLSGFVTVGTSMCCQQYSAVVVHYGY
jgi:hypothetical protein